jgi:uncharacterized protein YndB with AHSA1/START domain
LIVSRAESGAGRGQDLVLTRTFDASRELMWRVWTECRFLKLWWGPRTFTAPHCKIDLRVGGRYLHCMRSPKGRDFWSTGVYLEIVRPERLVCTDSFADAEGSVVPASHYGLSGDWAMEMLLTILLEERDGQTHLTLVHAGLPPGKMTELTATGWNDSFDKMTANLKPL